MNPVVKPPRRGWRALPFAPPARPLVTLLELSGVIASTAGARRSLSMARLEGAIKAAFKPSDLSAVALVINSPGGSPVQSRLIHFAVRAAAAKRKVPVLAFIEDVGASGGYILALAADEIIADDSSIVGSIGVISAGFGFPEALARLGVERRVHTSGESKSQLDPFRPESPADLERLQAILDDLHAQFIDLVKSRRGQKLNDPGDCFTGAFWTARPALERGLIDGIGRLGETLATRFGDNVRVRRISPDRGLFLNRFLGGAKSAGAPEPAAMLEAFEERGLWARFGL